MAKRMRMEKVFEPKAICKTCERERPCSWHSLRKGMVCGDCWSFKDLPAGLKAKLAREKTDAQIESDQRNEKARIRRKQLAGPPPPHKDCY